MSGKVLHLGAQSQFNRTISTESTLGACTVSNLVGSTTQIEIFRRRLTQPLKFGPGAMLHFAGECRYWNNQMLILTRRVGETLMVGEGVTVTVMGVKGNQVRIGINAPKDVEVHREEINERVQAEKTNTGGDP